MFAALMVEMPLAALLGRPAAIATFEAFDLPTDPGQAGSLAALCERAGLDPYLVAACVAVLEAAPPPEPEVDWDVAPLAAHLDHLVRHHHAYLRRALPALGLLLERLVPADAALAPLRWRFHAFWQAVAVHLDAEELRVFAPLERLAAAPVPVDAHTVLAALPSMAGDHGTADGHLRVLGQLAAALPVGGPPGLGVLRTALGWLARDMARHVAEEDRGLFVRARLVAAAALQGRAGSPS